MKQIPFENNLLKCELLDLASLHKPVQSVYAVEELAAAYNVKILRTPPYQCELNPIEIIWAQVKVMWLLTAKHLSLKMLGC
jgi:transposase